MEALAAIGLASNLLQFTELGIKIVAKSIAYYKSGTVDSLVPLDSVLQDLHLLLKPVEEASEKGFAGQNAKLDIVLEKSSAEALRVGSRLRHIIQQTQSKGRGRLFSNVKRAASAVWRESELQRLQQSLQHVQDQVMLALSLEQRRTVQQLLRASKDAQHVHSAILTKLDAIKAQLATQHNLTSRDEGSHLHLFLQTFYHLYLMNRQHSVGQPHNDTFEWILKGPADANSYAYATSKDWKLNFLYDRLCRDPKQRAEVGMALYGYYALDAAGSESSSDLTADMDNAAFLDWIVNGQGPFWLYGKPGCGKSTFMKFLAASETFDQLLRRWAGPNGAMVVSHFFWRNGSSVQKTQSGLLRSLIFQIIYQQPELAKSAFTQIERDAAIKAHAQSGADQDIWSIDRLDKALKQLAQDLRGKLHIHIDGLDEFEGNPSEIGCSLEQLGSLPRVRFLVSGRRLHQHEKRFGKFPKMAMDQLTWRDIAAYVADKCLEDYHMSSLMSRDFGRTIRILLAVVQRAAGVFLWVKLAVQSLIEGCDALEDLDALEDRLNDVPADLMQLYGYLIERLDDRYRSQAATWLLTIRAVSILSKHFRHDFYLFPATFALVQCYDASPDWIMKRMNEAKNLVISAERDLPGQMRARCPHFFCFKRYRRLCEWTVDAGIHTRIEVLHRTVLDFIGDGNSLKKLLSHVPSWTHLYSAVIAAGAVIGIADWVSLTNTEKATLTSNLSMTPFCHCLFLEANLGLDVQNLGTQLCQWSVKKARMTSQNRLERTSIFDDAFNALLRRKDFCRRVCTYEPSDAQIMGLAPFLHLGDLNFVKEELVQKAITLSTFDVDWILFNVIIPPAGMHSYSVKYHDLRYSSLLRTKDCFLRYLFPRDGRMTNADSWMEMLLYYIQSQQSYLYTAQRRPLRWMAAIGDLFLLMLIDSGATNHKSLVIDKHDFDCDRTRLSSLASLQTDRLRHDLYEGEQDTTLEVFERRPNLKTASILSTEGAEYVVRRPRRWSIPVTEQSRSFQANFHGLGEDSDPSLLYATLLRHSESRIALNKYFRHPETVRGDWYMREPWMYMKRRNSSSRLRTGQTLEDQDVCSREHGEWADLQHILDQMNESPVAIKGRRDRIWPQLYPYFFTGSPGDRELSRSQIPGYINRPTPREFVNSNGWRPVGLKGPDFWHAVWRRTLNSRLGIEAGSDDPS